MSEEDPKYLSPLREKLWHIVFLHNTKAGKNFDVVLLVFILLSVVVVMVESVHTFNDKYGKLLYIAEWILTAFFTVEYILRLWISREPKKYAFSFWGIIDLIAIVPTYLSLFIAGSQQLMIIRALRLLRAFRIFRLAGYLRQGKNITKALAASRTKIEIFLYFVAVLTIIIGCIMYLIEGGTNSQFTSIPRSVYWAIVTLTTVGYGDISPTTPIGQFFAAIVMILGYAIIAVPTGIVSSEMTMVDREQKSNSSKKSSTECDNCGSKDHDRDAFYCKICGSEIN